MHRFSLRTISFAIAVLACAMSPQLNSQAAATAPGFTAAPGMSKLERLSMHRAPLAPRAVASAGATASCNPFFSVFPTPNGTGNSEFNAVAAVSGTDIWAVGDQTNGAGIHQTLAEHWNGTSWSAVASPNLGGGNNFLLSAAAVSSNDVWAVGLWRVNNSSVAQSLTEHWNGSSWSVVSSPNVASTNTQLFGVRAISSSNVVAVG